MAFKFDDVDSIESVPSDFRVFYDEKDGKPVIREDMAATVGAFRSMSAALDKRSKELTEARAGKVDLSSLSDYGTTPDEIKETFDTKISELQNELSKGKDAKLNLDKLRNDMNMGFQEKTKKYEARIEGLTSFLHKTLVTEKATAEIASAKGDVELLMPFVSAKIKVQESDGEFSVFVVDDQGEQRFNHVGQPMNIKELVTEMKGNEKYGKLFASESPTGSGTTPGAARRTASPPTSTGNPVSKISQGISSGQKRFGAGTPNGM